MLAQKDCGWVGVKLEVSSMNFDNVLNSVKMESRFGYCGFECITWTLKKSLISQSHIIRSEMSFWSKKADATKYTKVEDLNRLIWQSKREQLKKLMQGEFVKCKHYLTNPDGRSCQWIEEWSSQGHSPRFSSGRLYWSKSWFGHCKLSFEEEEENAKAIAMPKDSMTWKQKLTKLLLKSSKVASTTNT